MWLHIKSLHLKSSTGADIGYRCYQLCDAETCANRLLVRCPFFVATSTSQPWRHNVNYVDLIFWYKRSKPWRKYLYLSNDSRHPKLFSRIFAWSNILHHIIYVRMQYSPTVDQWHERITRFSLAMAKAPHVLKTRSTKFAPTKKVQTYNE